MDDQFEYVNCLICGKDDTEVFVRGNGPAQIVKCRNDGLLYLNPRPASIRVRDFHTEYVRNDNLDMFTLFRREVLRREADAIKSMKSGGNLLDIGCATGTFFENFIGPTWHLYGVETSPLGVELARSRYGAEVFCGTLREAGYPSAFFDVVSILDTLFLLPDPRAELIEIKRILKDEGLLAVEIPGLSYRLFLRDRGPVSWVLNGKWSRMSTDSWHLYYFSPSTLNLLLTSVGFRVVKAIPEQASLGRRGVARTLNDLHFALARLLFKATAGRFSIAGKELYLAMKMK
jgi:SAM-dependent methyltransferase